MTNIQRFTIRKIPAALAVMAAASIAMSVGAEPMLQFKQNSGFFGGAEVGFIGPPFIATVTPGNAGAGGLEFFTQISYPPGIDPPPAPQQAYGQVAWGCLLNILPSATTCANAGVATPLGTGSGISPAWGTPAGPFAVVAGRSSLEVEGLSGNNSTTGITGPGWTNISKVTHHNNPIDASSNKLDGVDISSWFQLGTADLLVEGGYPSVVGVNFVETPNDGDCTDLPVAGAPVNPLKSDCDDFAIISGADFTTRTLEIGSLGNGEPSEKVDLEFRPFATEGNLDALVCLGDNLKAGQTQDARCLGYNGADILVYTAEGSSNELLVQARLVPRLTPGGTPLFVIGDCEYEQWKLKKNQTPPADNNTRETGDDVNFWGAQWWKNNCMSLFTDNGYPSFKGYATNVSQAGSVCGTWEARPGNSGHPPATLPRFVSIIVTDNVIKNGPVISGNIKQIVTVDRFATVTGVPQDRYAGNPGHAGSGEIIAIECGPGTPQTNPTGTPSG